MGKFFFLQVIFVIGRMKMPKVLPRHRNNATGQLSWDEFYNVLTAQQQQEFWNVISGSTTVNYTNSISVPTWGDGYIVFGGLVAGGSAIVELDIRIPVDLTLGASGFLRVAANSGNINDFSAGVRCYADDLTFLGERRFIFDATLVGTADSIANEVIFDIGAGNNQFPAETSFVKPVVSWSSVTQQVLLKSFVVRPLDNARKALYT